MQLHPFLFKPNFHITVWGGNQLRPYKGLESSEEPVGESWEVSAVPSSISMIANGAHAGEDLISVIEKDPAKILGEAVNAKYDGQLPLLVKFIDAKEDLSIQVHPNDEMAMRVHGKKGKSEMWYRATGSALVAGRVSWEMVKPSMWTVTGVRQARRSSLIEQAASSASAARERERCLNMILKF